jgi:predicted GNAT family acetyltransferase
MASVTEVTDNPELGRYELRSDGELVGYSEYRPAGENVIVAHTEIEEGHEGEGLGSILVAEVLHAIRDAGKMVIPVCPFTAAFIARHPDYIPMVVPSLRGQFG